MRYMTERLTAAQEVFLNVARPIELGVSHYPLRRAWWSVACTVLGRPTACSARDGIEAAPSSDTAPCVDSIGHRSALYHSCQPTRVLVSPHASFSRQGQICAQHHTAQIKLGLCAPCTFCQWNKWTWHMSILIIITGSMSRSRINWR